VSKYPPIQIVDEKDEPIGESDMKEAHEKGLIHRIVFIGVQDPDGRLLLQRRSKEVLVHPDTWDISAAGHVDAGESYEEAAKRELEEEIGLSGYPIEEISRFYKEVEINGRLAKRFCSSFRVKVPKGVGLKPDPEEVSDLQWFTIDEVKKAISKNPGDFASGLFHYLEYSDQYENNEH
jgi:16S rRNA (adenine1518-N6/adenine1519-N6)-dimethyltransferase